MTALSMAQAGAFYAFINDEFVTLRDLLERERGHYVSDIKAWSYCIKHRKTPQNKEFIEKFINYAKKHEKSNI